MKIAVIGGNGFIGKEFVKYAGEKGHQTFVIGSNHDVFSFKGRKVITEFLSDSDAMVFLAARRYRTDFSVDDYIYNLRLASMYLELARSVSLDNIVIASSIGVYSNRHLPWNETLDDTPSSLYGASKKAIDSLALMYNQSYGTKIKSFRLAQVIGMGERKGYLLNTLIDNAIKKRTQMIYGKGEGRRQYIYIKDVCDVFLYCIEKEKENAGIFNIGMKDNISIIDLAYMINDVFENDKGVQVMEEMPEDRKEYLMDISKAEKELHWRPHFDLILAFEDMKNDLEKSTL